MISNYKKFFESKKDEIFQDVKNITVNSMEDLNLLQIDDPNLPWGPCVLIEDDYNDKYLHINKINGVYAVELTKMGIIKICIRFGVKYMTSNESLLEECIEELEDRLRGENYDFERREFSHGQINLYRYYIYIGKWSHSKDEWGSKSTFISEIYRSKD